MQSFDREGKPTLHWSFRREGKTLLQKVVTTHRGAQPSRTVRKFDGSFVTDIEVYSLDGALQSRTVMQRTGNGVHAIEYDGKGRVVSDEMRTVVNASRSDGFSAQLVTNGKVISQIEQKRTAAGVETDSSVTGRKGLRQHTTVEDKGGTRSVDVAPNGRVSAIGTNQSGDTATFIQGNQSGGSEERTVQHYDQLHRLTSVEVYAGDILHHQLMVSYRDDEFGNWVKMVNEQHLGNGEPQAVTTTVRTISYY
jgi:hypothetical protein